MRKTSIFSDIYKQGMKAGRFPGKTLASRTWYRNIARKIAVGDEKALMKQEIHFARREVYPGFMYTFVYDAKTKDKLPYWDSFPLVFPFGKTEKGFIGLNLHYLPPHLRAILMDELYNIVNNEKYNDNTRLQAFSYEVLKKASSMELFKPCIHSYLTTHVRSKLYKIPANSWDVALMLPTERFQKATKEDVWKDSEEHAYKSASRKRKNPVSTRASRKAARSTKKV